MRPFNLPISNSFVILSEALFSGVEGPAFPAGGPSLTSQKAGRPLATDTES
jgi:hypothetical protein